MVSTGKFSVRPVASFMSRRELDIDGAEHGKNKGLEQTHQQLQEVKWKRKQDQRNPVEWRRQTGAHRSHRVQKRLSRVNISE